jgi:hypothetical protein
MNDDEDEEDEQTQNQTITQTESPCPSGILKNRFSYSLYKDICDDDNKIVDYEDDVDWCEDSMAVELSSVDSMALNDFRECGFNLSNDGSVRSKHSTENNKKTDKMQSYLDGSSSEKRIKIKCSGSTPKRKQHVSTAKDDNVKVSNNNSIKTNNTIKTSRSKHIDLSSSFMGLSDSLRASDWLAAANNQQYILSGQENRKAKK